MMFAGNTCLGHCICKHTRSYIHAVLFAFIVVGVCRPHVVRADATEYLIRPTFQLAHENELQTDFDVNDSFLRLTWPEMTSDPFHSNHLKATSLHLMVGSRELVLPPAHYEARIENKLTLVEGYFEYQRVSHSLQLGMIPLKYGYNGSLSENEILIERPYLYEARVVGLRDLGAAYHYMGSRTNGRLTWHMGEGGADHDGEYWLTGHLAQSFYESSFQLGLMGQTGRTKPNATKDSQNELAEVDPTRPAKWNLIGAFLTLQNTKYQLITEGTLGFRSQNNYDRKFGSGYIEVERKFQNNTDSGYATTLRYDVIDYDLITELNADHRLTLAAHAARSEMSSHTIITLSFSHDYREGLKPIETLQLRMTLK
jgi:hypothetical protein